MPTRFIKSVRDAVRGFRAVLREERNFRIQIAVAVCALAYSYYFAFSFAEWIAVFCAIVLVLMAEIVNTAIEDLCNRVEPAYDSAIGKIKDIMAAYVLCAAFAALVLGIGALVHHFFAVG